MAIHPLHCPIQHYAWGSTSSIPEITAQENPQNLPWAEMWMGAHPKACSTLGTGESLADFLAKAGHSPLPFLFKILAAESALSIQCHPDKSQAEAGYDAEQAANIPITAPNRNYRDRNHKPELIVALTEFWALKGFRSPDKITELFTAAKLRSADPILRNLRKGGLRAFFTELQQLKDAQKTQLITELREGLSQLPEAEGRWAQVLLARYPDDIGVLAPLFLNLVCLSPGDALYLGSGELHAYLHGTGLEIMASSDNVLRGGLTPKHVDPDELSRVVRFQHEELQKLRAQAEPGGSMFRYVTPAPDFQLRYTDLSEEVNSLVLPPGDLLLLSIGGTAKLHFGQTKLELPRGCVALCTADTRKLRASGDARLWVASAGNALGSVD